MECKAGNRIISYISGTCIDGVDTYTCMCGRDYTGVHCETALDPCFSNPCKNGAKCVSDSSQLNTYSCYCKSSFSGQYSSYLPYST